jgi:hypothetical protein
MKLVPFVFTRQESPTLTKTKLLLFLSHAGKAVWQTEDSVVSEAQLETDYLQPNGFHAEKSWKSKDVWYIQVDKTKTNLSSFYTWEESLALPEKPECWRPFYFFQDTTKADLWTPESDFEIQGLGSLWSLYTVLRDTVVKI